MLEDHFCTDIGAHAADQGEWQCRHFKFQDGIIHPSRLLLLFFFRSRPSKRFSLQGGLMSPVHGQVCCSRDRKPSAAERARNVSAVLMDLNQILDFSFRDEKGVPSCGAKTDCLGALTIRTTA